MPSAPLGGITLGGSQNREEGQGPHPRSPRDLHQQHHANPPQSAALDEGFVGGTDRVAVNALCGDPLTPASLQHLLDANYQGTPFGHERLNQRSQQHSADLKTRPASTAEDSVVTVEALVLVQAHRPQRRADRSPTRSEDRADQKQLGVLEDSLREQWREGGQRLY